MAANPSSVDEPHRLGCFKQILEPRRVFRYDVNEDVVSTREPSSELHPSSIPVNLIGGEVGLQCAGRHFEPRLPRALFLLPFPDRRDFSTPF